MVDFTFVKPIKLTMETLKGIRDEARKTSDRVDSLSIHIDQVREELSRRIVESESRTSAAIAELAANLQELISHLEQANDLRPRV